MLSRDAAQPAGGSGPLPLLSVGCNGGNGGGSAGGCPSGAIAAPAPAPAPAPAAAAAAATSAETAAAIKQLIGTIPTKRDELYAAPVGWDAVERGGLLAAKIRPWLGKKVAELMGEEEDTLVEFVLGKLGERQPAEAIEGELMKVLDDEAEGLTLKLWRMLLFEIKRADAGI